MTVYMNTVAGTPDWASLPAAKIIDYPLEARDYRPFAQVQFALSPAALWVRAIAFEVSPDPHSAFLIALGGAAGTLAVSFAAPGGEAAPRFAGASPGLEASASLRREAGEDLQGVYWGGALALPLPGLLPLLAEPPSAGRTLPANVFKVCRGGERDHFGQLFPAPPVWDAAETVHIGAKALGGVQIVGY